MRLACPNCHQVLEFSDKPLRFCGFCGKPLPVPAASTTEEQARAGARTLAPAAVAAGAAAADPEVVGGYRLLRKLGAGGMGTVHEAEDQASGQRVALKLIAAEYAESADAVERFRREGQLASAIAHPRCVFV